MRGLGWRWLNGAFVCLLVIGALDATADPRLNEFLVNPVDVDDNREYVEIRGQPGASLTGLALVEIDGNSAESGVVDMARDLGDLALGLNGLLILGDDYTTSPPYPIPEQTTVADLNRPGGGMENGVVTFLLVSNFTGSVGDDLDVDGDGVLDATPWGRILDGVGWGAGDGGDAVYCDAELTQLSGSPDAATRFPTNDAPNSVDAWYNGDVLRTEVDLLGLTYDPVSPSSNMPPDAVLTPGAMNFPLGAAFRRPPVILPVADPSVFENESINFAVAVVATDGDPVTQLYASGIPGGAQFVAQAGNTNGLFTWPSASPVGVYTTMVRAVDIDGTNSEEVIITVYAQPAPSRVLLNEIFVNPTGGSDDNREYIEVRGIPGAWLDGLSVLEIEGDGTGAGRIDAARSLTGLAIGSNGLLILGDDYTVSTPYTIPAGTTLADLNRPGVTMENGTITFLLVTGFTGSAGMDLDLNNDGTPEVTPWSELLDGIAWSDGGAGDRVYCPATLDHGPTPDAASRCGENDEPLAEAAWYFGEVTTTLVDTVGITYLASSSSNLPAGVALTPGSGNAVCGSGFADLDGDRMGDTWEMSNGLAVGVDDSEGDLDQDGIPNFDEWIMDTGANVSNAMLRITGAAVTDTNLDVTFGPSSTARVYTIEFRDQLRVGTWTNLPDFVDLPGGEGESTFPQAPANGPLRFYRVTVERP